MTAELYLRKDEDRRLRAGHVWVYSNEIDTERSPLRQFSPGDPVDVISSRGQWLGQGYINPNTLIAARIV
ncbi:MAG: RlmI/RlmK family 23S rRNA methyltransferase, partial [Gammaproteobacteria bacterium]